MGGGTTRETATREEEALFATTGKVAGQDLTDKSPLEPRHTEKPGTRSLVMDNFIVKTKHFYKNFLDGLYAVADLLTEPDPEPKPPDIGTKYQDNLQSVWQESVTTGAVSLAVSFSSTPSKKRSFDFFVKKRRKKFLILNLKF